MLEKDLELANIFKNIYNDFKSQEKLINEELINSQGKSQDLKGYYLMDEKIAKSAMCPSESLNKLLLKLNP